jgi:hypothetical protein
VEYEISADCGRASWDEAKIEVRLSRRRSELDVTVRVGDWMLSACANLTLNLHLDLGIDVDGKLSY